MNAARKAQDKDRTLVLGTILANLKNREIDLRRPATDEEVVEVLRKGIKIRREAIEQYTAGGRTDLAGDGAGPDRGAGGVPAARGGPRRDPRARCAR